MIRTIQIIPNFPELEKYYTFDKENKDFIPLHYYDYKKEYCFHTQYFDVESFDSFARKYNELNTKYKLDEHLIELLFLTILKYGKTMVELETVTKRFSIFSNPSEFIRLKDEDSDLTPLPRDMAQFLLYLRNYNKPDNTSKINQIKFISSKKDEDFTIANPALIKIILSAIEENLKNGKEPMYKNVEELLILEAKPEQFKSVISAMTQKLQVEFINYILHYFKNVKTELPMIKPNGKPTKEAKNFFLELLNIIGFTKEKQNTKYFDNIFRLYTESWRDKLPLYELEPIQS